MKHITRYLEIDEVLLIHEEMITLFGGKAEVHDFTLLHSAISRSQATFNKKDLYPTIFKKAAALIQSLILNHPFHDGNKRTAITSCARFLYLNGWDLSLPKSEAYRFTISIDVDRIEFDKIVTWLENHSRKKR